MLALPCVAFVARPVPLAGTALSAATVQTPLFMAAATSSWPAMDDGRPVEQIHKMADAVL